MGLTVMTSRTPDTDDAVILIFPDSWVHPSDSSERWSFSVSSVWKMGTLAFPTLRFLVHESPSVWKVSNFADGNTFSHTPAFHTLIQSSILCKFRSYSARGFPDTSLLQCYCCQEAGAITLFWFLGFPFLTLKQTCSFILNTLNIKFAQCEHLEECVWGHISDFTHCWDKILDQCNLMMKEFILAPCAKDSLL